MVKVLQNSKLEKILLKLSSFKSSGKELSTEDRNDRLISMDK
ncbi:hypothetical protein FM107_12605 [Sphingobacterium sp. JB170]|nr:hypothetical protein FM107_12605 [Sphingobacterium sp. JB170]